MYDELSAETAAVELNSHPMYVGLSFEIDEAEESAFDVPVPTESYDSAPTYLPALKKGKMTQQEVDSFTKLKEYRKRQARQDMKMAASARTYKVLQGADSWLRSWGPKYSPSTTVTPAAPVSSVSSTSYSFTMDEGSAESHRSAKARSVTAVFQKIGPHDDDDDDNLVTSCELAYGDSSFLTQFKDVIARADHFKTAGPTGQGAGC